MLGRYVTRAVDAQTRWSKPLGDFNHRWLGALFHPIRLALTGADSGPELDLLVPAIDAGADVPRDLGLAHIVGCRERAAICAAAILGA